MVRQGGVAPLIVDVAGRRCTAVRRVHHHFADEAPSAYGPLEIAWDDGGFTTVDALADWTLEVVATPWADPFAAATAGERQKAATEVGLWKPVPADEPLSGIVGLVATAVNVKLNEMGEPVGLRISFGEVEILAFIESGDLFVSVRSTPSQRS